MRWDDLTQEQQQAAVTAVARVENNGDCSCGGCMAVYEAMAKAVVESLPSPATQTVPWEPRDGWPTTAQVDAWKGEDRAWYCAGGPVTMGVVADCIVATTPGGVVDSRSWRLGLAAVVPFRHGRPTSWTEVDAAVVAMEAK